MGKREIRIQLCQSPFTQDGLLEDPKDTWVPLLFQFILWKRRKLGFGIKKKKKKNSIECSVAAITLQIQADYLDMGVK